MVGWQSSQEALASQTDFPSLFQGFVSAQQRDGKWSWVEWGGCGGLPEVRPCPPAMVQPLACLDPHAQQADVRFWCPC